MAVSASEIEKLESSGKSKQRVRYTEEYRLEAVQYYKKAKEIDPEKTIKDCAKELGINEKTFNDWVVRHEATGKVSQARSDEQKIIDQQNKRIKELELENEFLKKAAAFFAKNLA